MDHPYLTVWNIEFVLKGLKIQRLHVYIVNTCRYMLVLIAHAQMSLIKAHVGTNHTCANAPDKCPC